MGFFLLPPLQAGGDCLDGEEAVQAVKGACYHLVEDLIGDVIYYGNESEGAGATYSAVLTQAVEYFFPRVKKPISKKLRNVINDSIFSAGVKKLKGDYPGTNGEVWVVRTDDFDSNELETSIQAHADYIRKLAAQI